MMTRGTTIVHTFTIPIKRSDISLANVIYAQNNNVSLIKKLNDEGVSLKDNDDNSCILEVQLSQTDTLGFDYFEKEEKNIIEIQVRFSQISTKEVYASDIMHERVGKLLDSWEIE